MYESCEGKACLPQPQPSVVSQQTGGSRGRASEGIHSCLIQREPESDTVSNCGERREKSTKGHFQSSTKCFVPPFLHQR